MGKKRKYDNQEDLDKELKKLRRKIKKMSKYNRSKVLLEKNESSAVSSEPNTPEHVIRSPGIPEQTSQEEMPLHQDVPNQIQVEVQTEETLPPVTEQETIDSEILTAMGTVEVESVSGPQVHLEIAQRWTPLLTKGLKKEEKALLAKQYVPFMNIPEMVPPKLNPELSAEITEPVKKRDYIIESRQKQIATALTAIGCGLQYFLTKGNKVDAIKNINDAEPHPHPHVMCDIFHCETGSRRLLIQNVINKDMKESPKGDPDTLLFGKALSENIKVTKAVQKSAKDLSKPVPVKPNKTNTNKPLIWRAPPQQGYKQSSYRQYNNSKQVSGGGKKKTKPQEYRKGPLQQHNQQRNYRK